MVKAFLHETPLNQMMEPPFTFLTAQTLLIYALWFLLAVLILRLKPLWRNQKQVVWVSFLWLLAFVPFFIWWEPWNIEFWVSSTAPCWVLMGVIVSDLSQSFSQPVLYWANRALVIVLWAGVVALMFFYNFTGVVNTFAATTPVIEDKHPIHAHQELFDVLDIKVRTHDLLILNGINTIPFYIDRYKKRDYLNLHNFLRKYQKAAIEANKAVTQGAVKRLPSAATPVPLDPWGDLTKIMRDKWAHHHKVWVLAEVVDVRDDWRVKLEKLLDLPPGQLTNYFNSFELKPVTYHKNVYFYQVLEPPQEPLESDDQGGPKP